MQIIIHNIETGEVIQRQINAEELAQYETDQAAAIAKAAQVTAAKLARAALLDKLGITADEAALLLG